MSTHSALHSGTSREIHCLLIVSMFDPLGCKRCVWPWCRWEIVFLNACDACVREEQYLKSLRRATSLIVRILLSYRFYKEIHPLRKLPHHIALRMP